MTKPLKKYALWFFAVLVAMEVTYVIVGNSLVRSAYFDQLINPKREEVEVSIENAITYIPGFVRVKRFLIRGQNGSVKWEGEVRNIRAHVSLVALLQRTLKISDVTVDGGMFRMVLNAPRLPKKEKKPGSGSGSGRGPWRFQFHNIQATLQELQLQDYTYRGSYHASGGFKLWPGRELEVNKGHIVFAEAEVTRQDQIAAQNFKANIEAHIAPYDLKNKDDTLIFDNFTHARLQMEGKMAKEDFLNLYLKGIPWLRFSDIDGKFSLQAVVREGAFAEGSEGRLEAENIGSQVGRFSGRGNGAASWRFAGDTETPQLEFELRLNEYSFSHRKKRKAFLTGKDFLVNANSRDLRVRSLFSPTKDLDLSVRVNKAIVSDMSFANEFIPGKSQFNVISGKAELNSEIHVSTTRDASPGYFNLSAKNFRSTYRHITATGDLNFESRLQDSAPGIDNFRIDQTRLSFRNVKVDNPKKTQKPDKRWQADFLIPSAQLRPYNRIAVSGSAAIQMDDLDPILTLVAAKSTAAELIQAVTATKKVTGRSDFQLGRQLFSLSNVVFDSTDVEIRGRMSFVDEQVKLLSFLKFGGFESALLIKDDKSDFRVTKAREWFNEQQEWTSIKDQKFSASAPR